MFWVSKVVTPLALAVGMAVTTTVVMAEGDGNQPPSGKGKFGKDDKKKSDDKKSDKKGEDKKGPPPKPDPQVDAWVAVLLGKITDPHDTVRDSARGAIVAVGPAALPALQKLADGDDPAKAVAARKLIHAIHSHHGHHGGPGEHGHGHGMGGHGWGHFGHPGMGGRGWGSWGGWGKGGERGGPPGMGGKGGERGGPPGKGPKRPGREEEGSLEVAPMPRDVAAR